MITLTQLTYILALEQTRHFGKAALKCHISQPTLSMQIKKAEELLGVPLFDRDKNPVGLSKEGSLLIEKMKSIVKDVSYLHELAKSAHTSMSLKIGIIPSVAPYLLPLFLDYFLKKNPNVSLTIQEHQTQTLLKLLMDEELDAAILATTVPQKPLLTQVLYEEPFYVFASKLHPYLKKKAIHVHDLQTKELWLMSEGHCLQDQVLSLCKDSAHFKSPLYQSGNLEALIRIISNQSGYTLIPALLKNTLSKRDQKNHVRPFVSPAPGRTVRLVYRKNQFKEKIMGLLIQSIQDHVRLSL